MSNINLKIVGGSPWGFRMMGGSEFNLPLTVENVTLNGKAMKHGLKVGDRIISCNGVSFEKITHSAAKENITRAKEELILDIYRKSGTSSSELELAPKIVPKNNDAETKSAGSTAVTPPATSIPMSPINKETTQPLKVTPSASTSQASVPPSTASQASVSPSTTSQASVPPSAASQVSTQSQSTAEPASLYPQPKDRSKEESPSVSQKSSTIVVENPQISRKPFQDPFAITQNTDTIKYKEAPPASSYSDPSKNTGQINIMSTKGNAMGQTENKVVRICCSCKEDIGTQAYVKLGERIWHSDHFRCSSCKTTLVGVGFFEDGDRILCKECYGTEKGPKCTACGKPCITEYVTAANSPYHANCFICTNCKRSLRGCPFNMYNETPHCMDCVTKLCSQQCCRCDKGILPGQEYIEASGKLYHENCFVCKICNQSLAGKQKYTIKNGEPCCPEHH